MLVGDIYGGRDYSSIGLSASTIACSFGKVVGQDKELQDYNPADVAMSLCRWVHVFPVCMLSMLPCFVCVQHTTGKIGAELVGWEALPSAAVDWVACEDYLLF